MVYADVLRPSALPRVWVSDTVWVLGGSVFIALSAQVAVPLPFTPVPVTGQTLAVLLVGALMGRVRAAICVAAYLTEGALGLPVFAGGGVGVAHLIGPTGGYLLGFMPAVWTTGWLAERGWDRRLATCLPAMLVGNACIYAFGLMWLARFTGAERVFGAGLWPFLPGDVLKVLAAAALLPSGWKLLGLERGR